MRIVAQTLAAWIVRSESLCFDLCYRIQTRATAIDFTGKQDISRGYWYLPTRPSVIRQVLHDIPIQNHEEYIFVDFGSGKGRVLLLAAEHGYKRIAGIELKAPLHEIARSNLRSCRRFSERIHSIELLNIDALDFNFPNEHMVLYFFNPFGPEILRRVLVKLQTVLQNTGRDVVLVMVNSEYDELMTEFPDFKLVDGSRLRSIYRRSRR